MKPQGARCWCQRTTPRCTCGWLPSAVNDAEDQLAQHVAWARQTEHEHQEKPSLLNRDSTLPEQASGIEAMEPRPGWSGYQRLDQLETDVLIIQELRSDYVPSDELEEFARLTAPFPQSFPLQGTRSQMGGIHSDPFVRVLAWRAWGRRDLDWSPPASEPARSTVNAPFRDEPRRQPASEPRALHSVGCDDPTCDGQRCAR